MTEKWPIPDELSERGTSVARLICDFLVERGLEEHGGGGKFYSPAEWKARDERYGTDSLLVITHDGGDHAAAFNPDYEDYALMQALSTRLADSNVFVEQCTSWYSAVHDNS
nr:hypothetical protein [Rhodococcus sp. (in: high G+C Gram-positive bacteria)]